MTHEPDFVKEINEHFNLYENNYQYEVLPKEEGWNCLYVGDFGGNCDRAWVYKWGEDTHVFVKEGNIVLEYQFDFWQVFFDKARRSKWYSKTAIDI